MKSYWWKKSVVYQIYPRSFFDANGDGIGDLAGITQRLDYIKGLGIDVIWLSPIYTSPNDDNGYDISDYRNIMADFGTMTDFDVLLDTAHALGLKIVLDLVVNHTSDEHPWFVESKKSKDNPYREYYIWKDKKEGGTPTNWCASFGGSAWEHDADSDMYYLHMFSVKQPDLNWENENVRKEVYDMMHFWCEKGIDGFRMDVISMISKVQSYPDGEVGKNGLGNPAPFVTNGPRVHEFLREMNREVLSKYDLLTVGECPSVTTQEAIRYAGIDGSELDMVFQFEHMDLDGGESFKWNDRKIKLSELKACLSKWQVDLYQKAWNSLYWCNHDQPRIISRLGDDGDTYRELSAKMLATCLHFMQGTPYVYQGEELGMTNYPFKDIGEYRDIESIHAYHDFVETTEIEKQDMLRYLAYKSRDNARTPMQWNSSKHAGFTTGEPWIEVNPNYTKINAKEQMARETSVYHYYRRLIHLRKEEDLMVEGRYELLSPEDENIWVYKRVGKDMSLLVLCNFTKEPQTCTTGTYLGGIKEVEVIIGNYAKAGLKLVEDTSPRILEPYEALVLKYHI